MKMPAEVIELHKRMDAAERPLVKAMGEQMGYGRLMQLAEQIWNEKQPGGAHSVGPCVTFLVPCPHTGYENGVACDWCCGSGRVTKRVLHAMTE